MALEIVIGLKMIEKIQCQLFGIGGVKLLGR
jgi:hypothetical protein